MKVTEKASWWVNQRGNSKASMAKALDMSYNTLTSRLQEDTPWMWTEVMALAKLMGIPTTELED